MSSNLTVSQINYSSSSFGQLQGTTITFTGWETGASIGLFPFSAAIVERDR